MFVAAIAQNEMLDQGTRLAAIENLRKLGYIYRGKPYESTVDDEIFNLKTQVVPTTFDIQFGPNMLATKHP
jgi:hypothetical protein